MLILTCNTLEINLQYIENELISKYNKYIKNEHVLSWCTLQIDLRVSRCTLHVYFNVHDIILCHSFVINRYEHK